MRLEELFEAKIAGSNVGAAMSKIISYIEKKLGAKFRKLGAEEYKNSKEHGFGLRFVEEGTLNCIRFNWVGSKSSEIVSVDLWNGSSHDPNFHIEFKGTSLAQSLPALVKVLEKPRIGKHQNQKEAALTEASLGSRIQYTSRKMWLAALPAKHDLIKPDVNGIERAQSRTKDFEGVAGQWDPEKGEGWIYSHYLDKKNLAEAKNWRKLSAEDMYEYAEKNLSDMDMAKLDSKLTGLAIEDPDDEEEARDIMEKFLAPKLSEAKKGGPGYYVLNEAKKGEYTEQSSVADMIEKLKAGRSFNRSEFVMNYHPENAHAYDEFVEQNKDSLTISGKRISLEKGAKIGSSSAGTSTASGELIVSKGGSGEEYEVDVPEPDKVSFSDSIEHLEGLATGLIKGSFNALFVAGRGGTGKTQTIEDVLSDHGLDDGAGYFKITGSASAVGIYEALYKNRKGIVLFDDCDGALESQDGRNIIKAATDTKKIRKIAWGKKSAGMRDPDDESETKTDSEGEDIEDSRTPRYFNFEGRVIFISNLPLNKLDPDGALRTRAFVINIDPTPAEMFERMEQILDSVKLESGSLNSKERQKVMAVVKTSRRAKDASLRTIVRALNLAASGAPNWEKLVQLYA